MKSNVSSHLKFPPGKETVPLFLRKQFFHGNNTPDRETDPSAPGNQFLQSHKNFIMATNLQPFVDKETVLSTLGTSLQPLEKPLMNTCTLTLTFIMEANPKWQPMNRKNTLQRHLTLFILQIALPTNWTT